MRLQVDVGKNYMLRLMPQFFLWFMNSMPIFQSTRMILLCFVGKEYHFVAHKLMLIITFSQCKMHTTPLCFLVTICYSYSILDLWSCTWCYLREEAISFSSIYLKDSAHMWFYFVSLKLLPCTHTSSISRERVGLIYCILIGNQINVRDLIHGQICYTVSCAHEGIWYPYLITSLYAIARVSWL